MSEPSQLSRRERQIIDALFTEGDATVNQVHAKLPDPPTPTAVRAMLMILLDKGLVRRRKRGREYVYRPAMQRGRAGRSALQRVIRTFYEGSLEKALAAHLADGKTKLSDDELERLQDLIETARLDND